MERENQAAERKKIIQTDYSWWQQTREKGTWVDGGTAPLLDGTRHWGTTFGAEGGVADLNTTPALGAE